MNKKIDKLLQKLKFKCIYAEEGCSKILDYSVKSRITRLHEAIRRENYEN